MYRIGLKAYFNELYIYFRGWRILLLLLSTLMILVIDNQPDMLKRQYIYILWFLTEIKMSAKQPKLWKLKSMLPTDARLRSCFLICKAVGSAIVMALWRISTYIVDMILGSYTLSQAFLQLISIDLLVILLAATPGEYILGMDPGKEKLKKLHRVMVIITAVLLGILAILYLMEMRGTWWYIPLTLLIYISVAVIWYVDIRGFRDWNTSYESLLVKKDSIWT